MSANIPFDTGNKIHCSLKFEAIPYLKLFHITKMVAITTSFGTVYIQNGSMVAFSLKKSGDRREIILSEPFLQPILHEM